MRARLRRTCSNDAGPTAMTDPLRAHSTPGSTPTSTRRCASCSELVRVPTDTPPGDNAPHAERTAELLEAMGLRGREAPGAGSRRCRPAGLQSITNLIVRRRYGGGGTDRSRSTRTATSCRPARAGRTTPTAA
ncbi:MAG: hypothetical protein MZW92_74490 [Comamonadaceae bacterium]|nr:hypothetical protein [Comamonadaceae bacterium]